MTWSPRSYQRRMVLARDGAQCRYCGRRVFPRPWLSHKQWLDIGLTFDHFIPRHDRGPSEAWNLFIACYGCNSDKGHEPPGGESKWRIKPVPANPIAVTRPGTPEQPMLPTVGSFFPEQST